MSRDIYIVEQSTILSMVASMLFLLLWAVCDGGEMGALPTRGAHVKAALRYKSSEETILPMGCHDGRGLGMQATKEKGT